MQHPPLARREIQVVPDQPDHDGKAGRHHQSQVRRHPGARFGATRDDAKAHEKRDQQEDAALTQDGTAHARSDMKKPTSGRRRRIE
jgi:hypothetical protein